MRFDPKRIDADTGRDVLAFLLDAGVDAMHSSHEYEFHDYFCEILKSLGKKRVTHIVKLGEPHFDHAGFRPERMIKIIDDQLRALGTERIEIVQWLLRTQPMENQLRLSLFEQCRQEVAATAAKLIDQGKVGALGVFPYTPAFAAKALPTSWCRGLIDYLNPMERECVPFLDEMQARNQFCIAIRPLAAGKLLENEKFAAACDKLGVAPGERFALRYPLLHPAVCSVVLSISSRAHAESAIRHLQNVAADTDAFIRANAAFSGAGLSRRAVFSINLKYSSVRDRRFSCRLRLPPCKCI
jgi:aryl-alcohol dehydrogenase-like predicted oxidoreductase